VRQLLLDTHVFLWWLADAHELGPETRALIANPNNPVFVSAATAWEVSIKKSIGKLRAPDDLDAIVIDEGFDRLPISFFHGERAGDLPSIHRDPFDRMLIAQAQAEGLELVTADAVIGAYQVRTVDASR
jgi:PIN domain nuclease of toxin-antitoxin system